MSSEQPSGDAAGASDLTDALRVLRRLGADLADLAPLVTDADLFDAGPFRALAGRTTEWADFVVPVAQPASDAEVGEAIALISRRFAAHGRTPRLIVKEAFFPQLAPMLARAGMSLAEREPLLLCTPASFRPRAVPNLGLAFLTARAPDADLIAFKRIWRDAIAGEDWEARPDALAAFRHEIAAGPDCGPALARIDGLPVGTGHLSLRGEIGEVMRISIVPEWRRQGIAGAMTSFLVAHAFAAGAVLAWLTAASSEARSVYERLGFLYAGDELTFIPAIAGVESA